MKNLNSEVWNKRLKAMESVDAMIQSAGGRITPAVGDLMLGLKVI